MDWKAWLAGWLLGPGRALEENPAVTELTTAEAFEEVWAKRDNGPVLVFKHSTTCPISASAYRRVEEYLGEARDTAPPIYLVKVIESRPASNAVASHTGIRHESPQVLLIQDANVHWHASHGAISAAAIASAIETLDGG